MSAGNGGIRQSGHSLPFDSVVCKRTRLIRARSGLPQRMGGPSVLRRVGTTMNTLESIRRLLRRNFRGLWRLPDFRLLWLSLTVTSFGAQITNLALPLTAALLLHATPFQMGVLVALETLPFALVSLHAGVLLDRVRKRPIIIISDVSRGLALLSIPVCAWAG